jgi:hypothetical protein
MMLRHCLDNRRRTLVHSHEERHDHTGKPQAGAHPARRQDELAALQRRMGNAAFTEFLEQARSPRDAATLRQPLGNAAFSDLLDQADRAGAPHHTGVVQRTPLDQSHNVLTVQRASLDESPAHWNGQPVTWSAEGLDGTFFIGPPGAQVVVKPLRRTGEVEYAGMFLREFRVSAPQTARYPIESTEGQAIAALVRTAATGTGRRSPENLARLLGEANAFLVMERLPGSSVQSLSDPEALAYLQDTSALKGTGRMLAVDTFIDNWDRFTEHMNLRNYLYQMAQAAAPGVVHAIDNEVRFVTRELTSTVTRHPGAHDVNIYMEDHRDRINSVVDHRLRADLITRVLAHFREEHDGHAEAIGYLDTHERDIRSAISEGTRQALQDLTGVFETNRDLLMRMRTDGYDPESQDRRDPEVANRLADYLTARVRGMSAADAARQLLEAVEEWRERNRRSAAPSPTSAGSPHA